MADFPSTTPVEVTEVTAYIRFWLGNIDTDVISDADLEAICTPYTVTYTDSPCKATYYSTIGTLNWLIRLENIDQSTSDASGSVTSRTEKNKNRSISVEYEEDDSDSTGWETVLSNLFEDPTSIGCDPLGDDDTGIRCAIIGNDLNGYDQSFKTRRDFSESIRKNTRCKGGLW